ncbi:ANK_REP_REGION domain-containing protein [Trichoderma simmonsii]|uniref:ANK_REP_REGION domain-containing protein n=1 Tax=Trichoderma simmonsii TaxID=1491479 RepID=A0A8G0LK65_9HYPO|nr:ANK_REP_REGION domain-containing protein [Trichoderma simmonsii]
MSGRLVPRLTIPTQATSPNNQPISPNGRPATWSSSAQRKMARLYVFTTLSVDKIRAIINGQQPPDKTIQQSSANKRLQTLFDKEPRWLHPKDDEDMGRRITELANSPIQLSAASEVHFPTAHEGQGHSPFYGGSDYHESSVGAGSRPSSASPSDAYSDSIHGRDIFMESQASKSCVLFDIPEETPSQNCGYRSNSMGVCPRDGPFAKFLRATTFMTESSANTTGTFRKHLTEYSEPYVKVVKRLVKRFTSPAAGLESMAQEHNLRVAWNEDWIGGPEATTVFDIDVPLPGHLLNVDFSARFDHIESIEPKWEDWLAQSQGTFHWMTPEGPSPGAQMFIATQTSRHDALLLDRHRHTVLHFLAAYAPFPVLYQALTSGTVQDIVNYQNTAGQTFMHVLRDDESVGPDHVEELIRVARALNFNMLARDCYGRSPLHVLTMQGKIIRLHSLHDLDPREYLQRDALGFVPMIENLSPVRPHFGGGLSSDVLGLRHYAILHPALDPTLSNDPALSQESQLVQNIRVSMENRFHEDEFGHNGLHCLAMATLSLGSIAEKHGLDKSTESLGPRENRKVVDSSEQIMELRLDLLRSLLDAGQDPNHRDVFGNTPLMAFAAALPEENEYKRGPLILQLLIERGADVDARNKRGETALHVAVRFHRKLAARTLVKGGANVDARNCEFKSLLEVCDEKMRSEPQAYSKYLACRGWLSGAAHAVQSPTFWQEWEVKNRVLVE